jgi:DnaJ family protein C protein 7
LQAEKTFKEVSEAYSILSDSTKRQRYDNGVEIEDLDNPMGGMGGGGGMHGMDPNDLFSMFFAEQGGSPFGGGGGSPFGGGFHDFGGGHGGGFGGHPGSARGRRTHARQYR